MVFFFFLYMALTFPVHGKSESIVSLKYRAKISSVVAHLHWIYRIFTFYSVFLFASHGLDFPWSWQKREYCTDESYETFKLPWWRFSGVSFSLFSVGVLFYFLPWPWLSDLFRFEICKCSIVHSLVSLPRETSTELRSCLDKTSFSSFHLVHLQSLARELDWIVQLFKPLWYKTHLPINHFATSFVQVSTICNTTLQ